MSIAMRGRQPAGPAPHRPGRFEVIQFDEARFAAEREPVAAEGVASPWMGAGGSLTRKCRPTADACVYRFSDLRRHGVTVATTP